MDPVTAALVGWLVDRAATMSQRMLTRWLWGDKQANALHAVVSEAIRAAIDEMDVSAGREAIETLEIDGRVIATAEFRDHAAADGHRAWIVSCHPGRLFTRNQAITAMVLADHWVRRKQVLSGLTHECYVAALPHAVRKSRSPIRIVFPSPTRSVLIAPGPGGGLGRGPGCDLVAFGERPDRLDAGGRAQAWPPPRS